ncbi:MAG: hypothetical protein ABIJ31_08880 [Pseudomonadota bacterium]
MRFDFWNINKKDTGVKQSKPKDLPQNVGMRMVTKLNYDSDWVWSLKMVAKLKEGRKTVYDFRAFDPLKAKEKGIHVSDYASLDGQPGLILFDGWYKKDTNEMEIKDRCKAMKMEGAA